MEKPVAKASRPVVHTNYTSLVHGIGETKERKFEEVVKSAERAAVLVY